MSKSTLHEKEVSPEIMEYMKAKGLKPPAAVTEQPVQPNKPEIQISAEDLQNYINKIKNK